MAIPTLDRDRTDVRGPASALRTLAAMGEWALAGAVCAGGAWAAASVIMSAVSIRPLGFADVKGNVAEATALGVGIGAACGLMIGVAEAILFGRNNRAKAVVILGIGGGLFGAIGGGLTPTALNAGHSILPPLVSSSLAWAVAGLLAGPIQHCWSRWISKSEEYHPACAGWALAGAVFSSGGWIAASMLSSGLQIPPLRPVDVIENVGEATAWMIAVSATCGLLIGVAGAVLFGRNNRAKAVVVLGAGGGFIGTIGGGLTPAALVAGYGVLPPLVSSAMAWAVAGLLAGPIQHCWSRWTISREDAEDDDEGSTQPQPKAATWMPEPRRRRSTGPILRFLPMLVVSLGSLVGAAVIAPSQVALALLAVGLLGLSVAGALLSQERWIRELERRLRRWE